MNTDKLETFVDNLGRTIIGELEKESKTTLDVKNPAIVSVQPNQQTGQISVQLIPYFFKEFAVEGPDNDVTWGFLKSNIVRSNNLKLDDRLATQYNNMYSVIQAPGSSPDITLQPDPGGKKEVVKLFDD